MKKMLSLFLSAILMFSCLIIPVSATGPELNGTAGDNITWQAVLNGKEVTITFTGTGAMNDYTATDDIAWNKFGSYYDQIHIVIESGITHIGNCAFKFSAMTDISIPDTVESIGASAFLSKMTKNSPSTSRLKSVQLPSGVSSIGASAFQGTTLTSAIIENTDAVIDATAFSMCDALTSFTVGEKVYPSFLEYQISANGKIPGSAYQNRSDMTTYTVPDGVTEIGPSAFSGCTNLQSIVIPSSVKTIDQSAFYGCTALNNLAIPEGVQMLGTSAFQNCTGLQSVSIPDSLGNIGSFAFMGCTNLSSVSLAEGITAIGPAAFKGCKSLTAVNLPESLLSINSFAFHNTGLTQVRIPKAITLIDEFAFGFADNAAATEYDRINGFTVKGYAGTVAETYAQDFSLTFSNLASSGSSSGSAHHHTWDNGVITVEPTATANGSITYTCRTCGAERIEVVAAGNIPSVPGSTVTVSESKPPVTPDTGFTDVPNDAYYKDAVVWAVEQGITQGTGDGTTFLPNGICTRGQVVTFLWRAFGSPEPKTSNNQFSDVGSDAYCYKAVLWAAEQKITQGTGDGTTFSPDQSVTRAQTVTFLWRAASMPLAQTVNTFTDVDINSYYGNAVIWAVKNEITNGTGDGTTFSPDEHCTRAQIVTFIYRYMSL